MITTIKSAGLGEADFSHTLDAVNLIHGPAYSGKTSILRAIQLGLVGYVAKLGKTGAATLDISRNGNLSVQLDFADGTRITRVWARKGKTVKAIQEGAAPEFNEVMLDPGVFFSLGATDRMRYIYNAAGVEREGLPLEIIAAVKNIRLETNTPETEKAIRAEAQYVDDSDTERHECDKSITVWLAEIIAKYAVKAREIAQAVKRLESTMQGNASVSLAATAVRQRTDIPQLIEALATAKAKRIELETRQRQAEDTKQFDPNKVAAIEAEIAKLTKERDAIGTQKEYTSKTADLRVEQQSIANQLHNTDDALSRIQEEGSKDRDHTYDILGRDKCPTCGANSEGWKRTIEEEHMQRMTARGTSITELTARRTKLLESLKAVGDKLDASRKADEYAILANDSLRHCNRRIEILERNLSAARAEAAAPRIEPPAADEIKAACVAVSHAEEKLTNAQVEHRAWQSAMDARARDARVLQSLEALRAEAVVTKEVHKLLEDTQAKLVDQAFGKILDNANVLAGACLKSPLVYDGDRIGRRTSKGVFIPLEAFSGSEEAVAFCAISVALSMASPFKLVVIDEMGRMDTGLRVLVCNRLKEMVDHGLIHQVILVDTTAQWAPEYVNRIEVKA